MMNFTLGLFWDALKHLQNELEIAHEHVKGGRALLIISDDDRDRLKRNMQFTIRWSVEELAITAGDRVCSEIRFTLAKEICRWDDINSLLQELWRTLEWETKLEHFFHYSREMARLYESIDDDWGNIIKAFPSARKEVEFGIDCYAIGDLSGCVFHMMRVAELGLRAIARERGIKTLGVKKPKPIEWGTWQEVFDAIEQQLVVIRRTNPGPRRDAAFVFYDTALTDLRRMRDLYRDPTMHFRDKYGNGEAYDSIFRTKGLMEVLSARLNEMKPRKIRW